MCLKDFFRYRHIWLGVAMIWIVAYHCPFDFGFLNCVKKMGYGGVDICLFASGIGCFYSLSSDSNILNFMKRRIKRLVPTYIIFIIVWLVYQYIIGNFDFQMALGNILALQNFTGLGNAFNWYISAIFLLYILAPYFKIIIDRATNVKKIFFLIFLLVCSIAFWHATTYIITVTRLPIFFIGMLFADMCKKDKLITLKHTLIMTVAFIVGVTSLLILMEKIPQHLWAYGLYWYPFILITPPLCFAISRLAMVLEKSKFTKPIVSLLGICGDYSFEIYLLHILLVACVTACIDKFSLSNTEYLIWIAGGVALFVGCFLLRRMANLFNSLFKRK